MAWNLIAVAYTHLGTGLNQLTLSLAAACITYSTHCCPVIIHLVRFRQQSASVWTGDTLESNSDHGMGLLQVVKVVGELLPKLQLDKLPLYAFGASSGGAFALSLPIFLPLAGRDWPF
jgi:hypothetical protein